MHVDESRGDWTDIHPQRCQQHVIRSRGNSLGVIPQHLGERRGSTIPSPKNPPALSRCDFTVVRIPKASFIILYEIHTS